MCPSLQNPVSFFFNAHTGPRTSMLQISFDLNFNYSFSLSTITLLNMISALIFTIFVASHSIFPSPPLFALAQT